jgi:lipid-A-disaccharide synthase
VSSCLVIAGEKSGEDHFMSLYDGLMATIPDVKFFGVGGEEMKESGVELLYHLKEFSSWGYSEVWQKIPFYLRCLNHITQECVSRNVKSAILIDFQEFNLRLAAKLKQEGIKVYYYVAPQAWAWKSWRVKKLAYNVHALFVILPFEKKWFEERGVPDVQWVAHPLKSTYEKFRSAVVERASQRPTQKLSVLLLPGSRKSEVQSLSPDYIECIKMLRKKYSIQVSTVKARHLDQCLYEDINKITDKSYDDNELAKALLNADICIAASGTVTLTCALFAVPTIVTYRSTLFNYYLFEQFVSYKGDVSLANLVLGRRVFPELIQEKSSSYNFYAQCDHWFRHFDELMEMKTALLETYRLISGDIGDAGQTIGGMISSD